MRAGKIAVMALSLAAAAAVLAGCGAGGSSSAGAGSAASQSAAESAAAASSSAGSESAAPASSETSSGSAASSILVVYFSATGNTEAVAAEIADALDADLFEVTPAEPYTDEDLNWRDDGSRVVQEHEDPSLQDVELTTTEVPDWSDYDTVFLGYPIWWGGAAWPMGSFVSANDFTGKTVIPFCTSASSDLGESASDLEALTGTGTWLDGQRFESAPDSAAVRDWALSVTEQ